MMDGALSTGSSDGAGDVTYGGVGPWNTQSQSVVPIISGPDLTNITSQSIVTATEINTGITGPLNGQGVSGGVPQGVFQGPECRTWDPFQNGFHVYCGNGNGANPNTELRVAVLNPKDLILDAILGNIVVKTDFALCVWQSDARDGM
jgi:hypothetical protein